MQKFNLNRIKIKIKRFNRYNKHQLMFIRKNLKYLHHMKRKSKKWKKKKNLKLNYYYFLLN